MYKVYAATLILAAAAHSELTFGTPAKLEEKGSLCSPCYSIGSQGINTLLNYVLNAGVIGGCGKLCGHLTNKLEQEACSLLCAVEGLKAFEKVIQNADLDPIYFCELAHACKPGPDDAAIAEVALELSSATVSKKDIAGAAVKLTGSLTLNVTKASGVGEFRVAIEGPEGAPQVGGGQLLPTGLTEGLQKIAVDVSIQDQPFAKEPVDWPVGDYNFKFQVCQGECGSKHPHSIDFGSKSAKFSITADGSIIV